MDNGWLRIEDARRRDDNGGMAVAGFSTLGESEVEVNAVLTEAPHSEAYGFADGGAELVGESLQFLVGSEAATIYGF